MLKYSQSSNFEIFFPLESASKKRKFSEADEQLEVSKNGTKADESLNSSTGSITGGWETKLLRSDLIEAQTRVNTFTAKIRRIFMISISIFRLPN